VLRQIVCHASWHCRSWFRARLLRHQSGQESSINASYLKTEIEIKNSRNFMNRLFSMLVAYRNIIQCEAVLDTGTDVWRSIAALMLPCYREQLKALAKDLSADEQREFERIVVEFHGAAEI
jgi:hypothetical protein